MRCIPALIITPFLFNSCTHSQAEAEHFTKGPAPVQITSTLNKYCWQTDYNIKNAVINRIAVPEGFVRTPVKPGSFADWLRFLPLKAGKPEVHLFSGELKRNQNIHHAVVDIDVGTTDLQQCADAVMRMRAEYFYSRKDLENIHFNFTSGHSVGFKKWSEGYRTIIKGNDVTWTKSAANDDNYKTFRSYLNTIFNYAGSSSLSKEMKPVNSLKELQIGDVFILGGFPGHAVLVIDMCENSKTGEKLFLIQQSYMPAQEIHILKNENNVTTSPWYSTKFTGDLLTPEWTFSQNQLMRF